MREHDYEPAPGLPAPLPPDEAILWQGSPNQGVFARRAMKVRIVAVYFAILLAWCVYSGISSATPSHQLAISALRLTALGFVAVALLELLAWLYARTTIYTITTRRVVLRYGIALPMTLQIPYSKIDAASVHAWFGGAGNIALELRPGQRIAYLVLWPHARPWKVAKAQPTLRGVPDVSVVAQILGRALAASASQTAQAVTIPAGAASGGSAQVPAIA